MTMEDKLQKAIDFIKSLTHIRKEDYSTFSLDDVAKTARCECEIDECYDVTLSWPNDVRLNTEYIDYKVLDDISDKAWHVLFDLEN